MYIGPKVTGIYKIVNTINGKKYVGSAVDIKGRWSVHKSQLKSQDHHSIKLQRAWNKHGEEAFEFVIIEECQPIKEIILGREQFWIDKLHAYGKNGYNVCPFAANVMGYKHTQETKKKLSIARRKRGPTSKETREKMSATRLRKTVSEEARRNISAGQKGKFVSQEARKNMSAAQKNRPPASEETRKN